MGKSLKDQNIGRLLAVVVGNIALFVLFAHAADFNGASFYDQATKLVWHFVPAALAAALLTVLNGLLGAQTKARLVFWRWSDPLPGSRAFSFHAKQDPRVNVQSLKQKLGKWPKNAREQNTTWYGLYRTVESDPAVTTGHRDFLFTRDYAGLAALFFVFLGGLAIYQFHDVRRAGIYIGILAAQYLIVRFVAALYGSRLVTTVLALKSAEQ